MINKQIMSDYMDHTHPDAFKDLVKREIPVGKYECPKCKGHGYWNLRLNSYPRYENPEDRHFKTTCATCWGYGYVDIPNPCEHEWGGRKTIGNCLHEISCAKCGVTRLVDSSG